MKVWPIDPLVLRSSKLEVPEKLSLVLALEAGALPASPPPAADDTTKLRGRSDMPGLLPAAGNGAAQ
jgi:hypothetical protein